MYSIIGYYVIKKINKEVKKMDKEKMKLCFDNIIKNKEARDNQLGKSTSFSDIDKRLNTINTNIHELIKMFNETNNIIEYTAKKEDKEFNMSAIEVFSRENISQILGVNKFAKVLSDVENMSDKDISSKCGNILARINRSVEKNGFLFKAISHSKNQYRIVFDYPKEYHNVIE